MSKEIKAKENTEVSTNVIDLAQYAGAGLEDARATDFAIPFLRVVQKNSPIIDTDDNARPGMLVNSVTGTLYKDGLVLIPCHFKMEWLEWGPDTDKGLKGIHDVDSGVQLNLPRNDKNKLVMPGGNILEDTYSQYSIAVDPETGEFFPCVVAMTSTQSKKMRGWNTMIANKKMQAGGRTLQAPSFAYGYAVSTTLEAKDKNTWYGWVIKDGKPVENDSLLEAAIALWQSAKAGEVTGKQDEPGENLDDSDIPF